jgi:uncharacterized protein DUF6545
MTARDFTYLGCAAVGFVAIGFKFRHLRRQWGTPQLWAVIVSIFISSVIYWSASPESIHLLNRATGIANFTAPLVYCLGTAFAGSTLTLAIFWRYPPERAWPRATIVITAYMAGIAAIAILFSVSDVPVERITDFETYYARQPTVAALLMVYDIMDGIGLGLIAYGCLKWSRSVDLADRPWLRRGLFLYGFAALLGFASFVEKFSAVVSNWFGLHWLDTANTVVPLVTGPPGMVSALCAVVLPIWGPRLPRLRHWRRRWAAFWTLRRMHRPLRRVDPAGVLVTRGRRFDPHHRVRRQLIELGDFEWHLRRLFDPVVEQAAQELGRQASLSDDDLRAVVEAAQLKAALGRYQSEATPYDEQPGRDDATKAYDSTDFDSELDRWVRVARAFAGSPIVNAAVITPRRSHGAVIARHTRS